MRNKVKGKNRSKRWQRDEKSGDISNAVKVFGLSNDGQDQFEEGRKNKAYKQIQKKIQSFGWSKQEHKFNCVLGTSPLVVIFF